MLGVSHKTWEVERGRLGKWSRVRAFAEFVRSLAGLEQIRAMRGRAVPI